MSNCNFLLNKKIEHFFVKKTIFFHAFPNELIYIYTNVETFSVKTVYKARHFFAQIFKFQFSNIQT